MRHNTLQMSLAPLLALSVVAEGNVCALGRAGHVQTRPKDRAPTKPRVSSINYSLLFHAHPDSNISVEALLTGDLLRDCELVFSPTPEAGRLGDWSVSALSAKQVAGPEIALDRVSPTTWKASFPPTDAIIVKYEISPPQAQVSSVASNLPFHDSADLCVVPLAIALVSPPDVRESDNCSANIDVKGLDDRGLVAISSMTSGPLASYWTTMNRLLQSYIIVGRFRDAPTGSTRCILSTNFTDDREGLRLQGCIAKLLAYDTNLFQRSNRSTLRICVAIANGLDNSGENTHPIIMRHHNFTFIMIPGKAMKDPQSNRMQNEVVLAIARSLFAQNVFSGSPGIAIDPDCKWFARGLEKFYGRRLAYRARLIDLDTYAADLNASIRSFQLSPLHGVPDSTLLPSVGSADSPEEQTHRWDLVCLKIDQAIRRKSNGLQSLDSLVIKLLEQSPQVGPLSLTRLLEGIRDLSGDDFVNTLESWANGQVGFTVEPNCLSPCLRGVESVEKVGDFGFSVDRSLLQGVICGVDKTSDAHALGLRDGMPLVSATISAVGLKVTVRDGGESRVVVVPRRVIDSRIMHFELSPNVVEPCREL